MVRKAMRCVDVVRVNTDDELDASLRTSILTSDLFRRPIEPVFTHTHAPTRQLHYEIWIRKLYIAYSLQILAGDFVVDERVRKAGSYSEANKLFKTQTCVRTVYRKFAGNAVSTERHCKQILIFILHFDCDIIMALSRLRYCLTLHHDHIA